MRNLPEIIVGLLLIVFAALIYGQTYQSPASLSPGGLTPAAFPRALAVVIGCLSVVLIIKKGFGKEDHNAGPDLGFQFGKMIIFFLVIMSYIWLMPLIGYALSTFSFLMTAVPLIMPLRSFRNISKGFMFAFLATISVYVVFSIFLQVPLIEGPVDLFLRYRVLAFLGVV
jgi:hypothetical protein